MATERQAENVLIETKAVVKAADEAFAKLANLGRKFSNLELATSPALSDEVCAKMGLEKAKVLEFFGTLAVLAPTVEEFQPKFHGVL